MVKQTIIFASAISIVLSLIAEPEVRDIPHYIVGAIVYFLFGVFGLSAWMGIEKSVRYFFRIIKRRKNANSIKN